MSDIRHRLRIKRENIDKGLRDCLATPTGRAFLWWVYEQCGMNERNTLTRTDGEMAALMMARVLGKQVPGHQLENRAKLVDHRNWLLTLAENDEAFDDGRAEEKQAEAEAE